MRGPRRARFEALAQNHPFVSSAYQAWKDSKTQAERVERADDLQNSLLATDPEFARAWLALLASARQSGESIDRLRREVASQGQRRRA